ncbi:hypothetical protein NKK48_29115 [Mesorhizobium sp. C386A]|uniref:PD-(D/E)XK nuclease domain-containing protein n=1 Tax=unclassified Mesorhizobium TaxID=325217 RepID=UPI0003CE2960|nr:MULTISPECIES: hypothetical protein [unclassified Mesorhizobium]ESY09156.1 hypothetical protein X752_21100 [Mesorhizobium sp. LNJC398B00]ESY32063.1 hypothetical protein X748_24110 [Mesorhizobium sp. LNJC386A00]
METKLPLVMKALAAAQSRLQECRLQINAYAEADEYLQDYQRDQYLEDASEILKANTIRARAAIRIVFELLDLDESLKALEAEFEAVADRLGQVSYYDEYLGPYNEVVDLLSSRLDLVVPLVETPSEVREQRRVLVRMLRQLPHFIEGTGNHPKREKDVQDHLLPILRLAFPDVVREAPVPRQTKIYFPDFGIDSVGTAIEIKFVDDKAKAALSVGGLYEDMKGYANSGYSFFVGLIYMTGNYLTQDQVEAELTNVDTPKNWKVYLVVGAGGRVPKTKKLSKGATN